MVIFLKMSVPWVVTLVASPSILYFLIFMVSQKSAKRVAGLVLFAPVMPPVFQCLQLVYMLLQYLLNLPLKAEMSWGLCAVPHASLASKKIGDCLILEFTLGFQINV